MVSASIEPSRQELGWRTTLPLIRRQCENLAWHRASAFRSDASAAEQHVSTNSAN